MPDRTRVLYVDDDLNSLEIRAEILEEDHGFDVITATSVQEAINKLDSNSIDCVLSDLEMPDRDGFDLLEYIRDEDLDLPFILFTSRESEEIAEKAFEAGATDYFPKSVTNISYSLLAHRIEQVVSSAKTSREFAEYQAGSTTQPEVRSGGKEESAVDEFEWVEGGDSTVVADEEVETDSSTEEGELDEETEHEIFEELEKESGFEEDELEATEFDFGEDESEIEQIDDDEIEEKKEEEPADKERRYVETPWKKGEKITHFSGKTAESQGDTQIESEKEESEESVKKSTETVESSVDVGAPAGGEQVPEESGAMEAASASTIDQPSGNTDSVETSSVGSVEQSGGEGSNDLFDVVWKALGRDGAGTKETRPDVSEPPEAEEPEVPEPGDSQAVTVEAGSGAGTATVSASPSTGPGNTPISFEGGQEEETQFEDSGHDSVEGDAETVEGIGVETEAVGEDKGILPVDFDPEPGTNILVQCGSQDERKHAACIDLLGVEDVIDKNVLLIRYKSMNTDRLERIAQNANKMKLLAIGYEQDIPESVKDEIEVMNIRNPNELTRLGIIVTGILDDWESNDVETVVCYDSLDVPMNYKDTQSMFRFLHILLGKLDTVEAVSHFHADPGASGEVGVNTLKPLFDTVISIDDSGINVD